MNKLKILIIFALLMGIGFVFKLAKAEEEITAPPSEVDATTGWGGSIAFNPNNNTWLIVSAGAMGANGRIMDNNQQPVSPEFKIDNAKSYAGAPRAAFAPDKNKYLVIWAQEGSLGGKDTGDIYGRFIDPSGKFLSEPFNITPNDPRIPAISMLHYDSKNQRFVYAFASDANIYIKVVGTDGVPGAEVQVTTEGFRGAPTLAINENDNEYCISYQDSDPKQANMVAQDSSSLGVRRVDAGNFQAGPETIVSSDLFFQGDITYNSREDKYFVTWTKYDGSTGLGKSLNSCNGTDTDDTEDVDVALSDVIAYNPKSNTYAIIAQDCCSYKNNYIVLDSSLNVVDQGSVFLDTVSGIGNFAPFIAANTNNGTYAATSSDGYVNNRFISDLSAPALIGKTYGGGGSNFQDRPRPPVPTEGLPTDLGQLIQQIFAWALGLLGVAVFVMFFYAGLIWLTAAGNTAKTGEAKTRMTNAVFGAILLLSSYLILNTINPNFVKNTFDLKGIEKNK